MDFQDAENAYRDLKQQHAAGKLTDEEFEAKVAELEHQDAEGHWWQLGVKTGEWYMHDGQKWIKAKPPPAPVASAALPPAPVAPAAPPPAPVASAALPPAPAAPPPAPAAPPPTPVAPAAPPPAPVAPAAPPPAPVAPTAPPSAPVAPAAPPAAPVAPTAPPPTPVAPAAPPPADSGAAVEVGAVQKYTRGSVLPAERKRVAPAGSGSGKGLPTPMLIGMTAVVAVVAILGLVSAYFVISGVLGGIAAARATTTPARALALPSSPAIPTLTKVPIDTLLPPPTIEVTATEGVTPTLAAAKPPATKKTATPTPAGPTATATMNVPPGVYVTNIDTIPAKVNLGDTIGFKVSFLNTTGSIQTYNWFVKWYQCPEQCQDFKHSQGETLSANSNLATGSSAVSTSQNINLRTGISCDLIAIANYVDPVSQLPTPFQSTQYDGQFSFTPCH